MASSRKRVRYTLDVHFSNLEEKEAFQTRLKNARELLTPSGCLPIDNISLMNALLEAVEKREPSQDTEPAETYSRTFLRNSGE